MSAAALAEVAVFTLPGCVEHLLHCLPCSWHFMGGNPFHPLNSPTLLMSKWGTEGREPLHSCCSLASSLFQPLCKHPAPLRQAPPRVPCCVFIVDMDKPPGYAPSLKWSAFGLPCHHLLSPEDLGSHLEDGTNGPCSQHSCVSIPGVLPPARMVTSFHSHISRT